MLSKPNRMRLSSEFALTIKGGKRVGSKTLVVHSSPTEDTRVGFVVSKAVGNAVVRNRVRRCLRELLRERISAGLTGFSVVIRVLPEAAGASREQLIRDLDRCLGRVLA